MNKKLNTALFFLGATAVNLLIVIAIGLALFIPYALLLGPHVAPSMNLLVLVVVVMGSMAASFPIYRRLIQWFQTKVDFDTYFDPIVRLPSKKSRR